MLSKLALAAILASVASALPSSPFQTQQCATPLPNQVCPFSTGGYTLLCGSYAWGDAQQACYNLGLRPAIVSDADALTALSVIQSCVLLGATQVWIDSFNGLGADPCAYVLVSGAAVYSPGDQLCNQLTLPVLCQTAPTSTIIVTVPSVIVDVTAGTSTTFTTTCIQCNCAGSIATTDLAKCGAQCFQNKDAAPAQQPAPVPKAAVRRPHHCGSSSSCSHDRPPNCLDPQGCLPLCPFTVGGLHVIQANLTFNQAERECNKYGWNLADTYAGLHADVGFMQEMCANRSEGYSMWIRSYNGVDGGMCMETLLDDFYNVPIAFGWSADYCMQQPLYVLCQERLPAITGTGAFAGSESVTFTTITFGTTITIPSTTTTVTITNFF
jgi:hypothetical protein